MRMLADEPPPHLPVFLNSLAGDVAGLVVPAGSLWGGQPALQRLSTAGRPGEVEVAAALVMDERRTQLAGEAFGRRGDARGPLRGIVLRAGLCPPADDPGDGPPAGRGAGCPAAGGTP